MSVISTIYDYESFINMTLTCRVIYDHMSIINMTYHHVGSYMIIGIIYVICDYI